MQQMYELKLYFCFMENPFTDEYFMKKAMQEAELAFEKGEIPVGAVVVIDNKIIARTHNLTELLHDVTAHAEMQAITSAANYIGGKYLRGCTLYVTLEPCQMCAGALYWSQISTLVFGATDENRGYQKLHTQLHPKTQVKQGVLANECADIIHRFFQKRR
jgi:tRNA(adenine34) deaminase